MENNKTNPLISVIIPVYNVEAYLDRCVQSVVNQTYKNIEIILVDDGSPDNCPAMCDAWAKKDSRIKVIHKENGGLSSARNAGLDIMIGEFVCFVDSDDVIDEVFVYSLFCAIIGKNYSVAVCNFLQMDDAFKPIGRTYYVAGEYHNDEVFYAYLRISAFGASACNKLYRSSDIAKTKLRFDETIKWGEDHRFNYFFFKTANSAVTIDDTLYQYLNARQDSISTAVSEQSVNRWKLTQFILAQEKNNANSYRIVLPVYAAEILCCLRELLKSENDELINKCYQPICKEIQRYSNVFIQLRDLSIANKVCVALIKISPRIFKLSYRLFKGIN